MYLAVCGKPYSSPANLAGRILHLITIRRMLPDRGEVRLPRVEGLAVSGGIRDGAGASVSTLTTFPLLAH